MNNWPKTYDKRDIFLELVFLFAIQLVLQFWNIIFISLKFLHTSISFENLYSL